MQGIKVNQCLAQYAVQKANNQLTIVKPYGVFKTFRWGGHLMKFNHSG